jgi:arylsulfatase A-like enzyme
MRGDEWSRRRVLATLAAFGLGLTSLDLLTGLLDTGSEGDAETALPSSALYLCFIVLDGFRPEYRNLAAMPSLDALAASGISYDRAWVGQLESETPAGHATLTTGSYPKHDGIIGFEWRDPVMRREVMDGWELPGQLGQIGRDMQHVHAHSIPQAVKRANPAATVVALSSEKSYAADAMAAGAADYAFYHRRVHGNLVPTALAGTVPPPGMLTQSHLALPIPMQHLTDWDTLSGRVAQTALQTIRPQVMMVNLPGSDYYGHKFGGLESPHLMARVISGQDEQIGTIVQAYRDTGLFERTLFVITSDHGMVPNHHEVSPRVVTAIAQDTGAEVLFHTGGTGKYVYLTDRSQSRAHAVAAELSRLANITAAYFRIEGNQYEAVGPKLDPALDGAYRYLFSTFAGPSAPDVIAPYRENTIGATFRALYGNHGGMSWGAQTIPLVLSGPGVRRGVRSAAPARLVDVAPTVMRLMGMTLPSPDGIVLADALEHPRVGEMVDQTKLRPTLERHQEALREQSTEEIRQDAQRGIVARPRVAVAP